MSLLFSQKAGPFDIPSCIDNEYLFSHTLKTLAVVVDIVLDLSDECLSLLCDVTSHCCSDLNFLDF